MATSTKPSWKKLKRKLKRNTEKDGEFQDGDYEESEVGEYDSSEDSDHELD